MNSLTLVCMLALVLQNVAASACPDLLAPKVMIVNFFNPEGMVWYSNPDYDLLAQNVSVSGLSPPLRNTVPLFGDIHCTADGEVCQLVTGRSEINTALSSLALAFSDKFNLTQTYFLLNGIAGINPYIGSINSVTFARFAVQADMQYDIDGRELPSNFSTGLWALSTDAPGQFPSAFMGTEVFELNDNLRRKMAAIAATANLSDTVTAAAVRAQWKGTAGAAEPSVILTDTVTTNTYWTGELLAESIGAYTSLVTNGTAVYGTTQNNDNAALEGFLRGAVAKKLDFGRIILMRTASDYDRPPPGESILDNLLYVDDGAFTSSLENLVNVGVLIIKDILTNWASTYEIGIKADNYMGDVMGTLGGTPDFGPGPA
ncbi:hypothetical protein LTR10_017921 [Elasticomyces elasticus]|uniref:Purine nucleoside permease n=1 Tax=Exophiala sideris TaxID=1016849 RepID=A0ABR0IXY5_9EURO|nr:hypothetical protein LTR10_017921 [Elasticomyces elasticus]KAK5021787.1 hypothetical protein LTS07_010682 [Exophiala sideris]KAK5025853.1 hypothetical protein LTR13_010317 [Exophiala sideris]KAK5050217.1 hypothetical protein LTR69_010705 [Exophiala sideris]KAK5177024.1 hypothetical protein LTR44_010461 [Eurotiomycetes sp. CCFEE 6388]